MNEPYFSVANITPLSTLAPGSKIHIIGVCGVAMAPLAMALSKQGYLVSGSDKEFFEPMGSLLKKTDVTLKQGFSEQHIPKDCSLVVIGNAVTKNNVEVLAVEQHSFQFTIFPKLLRDTVIADKHSIVVSGTHGKTTTTSMLAAVLQRLDEHPGVFIGGQAGDFSLPLQIGTGKYSVVEGDEYDSAFFAKVPKFNFYDPQTLIVTYIEYDHADIYPSLEVIEQQFTALITKMDTDCVVIANVTSPVVARLLPSWKKISRARFVTYAQPSQHEVTADYTATSDTQSSVQVRVPSGETINFKLPIPGAHNVGNALAVVAALCERGFNASAVGTALESFQGVRRRQDLRVNGAIKLIDDFAHHPTAVAETLSAVREYYKPERIIALFEPRSATSRRKVFQQGYIDAFAGKCDYAFILAPKARELDNPIDILDVSELTGSIASMGTHASHFDTGDQLLEHLTPMLRSGDVVICMSNGSFDGVLAKLEKHLRAS